MSLKADFYSKSHGNYVYKRKSKALKPSSSSNDYFERELDLPLVIQVESWEE